MPKPMVVAGRFSELKPGDLVRLRSGGPDMTVSKIAELHNAVVAVWFHDGELREGVFDPVLLKGGRS